MNTEQEVRELERMTGERKFSLYSAERLVSEAKSVLKETQDQVWFLHEFASELVSRLETALRAQQGNHEPLTLSPCHLCSRQDDYQLFCRGQEMTMEYCAFCGRRLDHESKEAGQ